MNEDAKFNIRGIIKAIIFSLILTAIFLFVLSIVCYFGNVSDKVIALAVFCITMFSIFAGAFLISKNAVNNGFFHGGILGISYIIILILCSIITKGSIQMTPQLVTTIAGGLFAGLLGGIVGRAKA